MTFYIIVINFFTGDSRVSVLGGLSASQVSELKDSAGCLLVNPHLKGPRFSRFNSQFKEHCHGILASFYNAEINYVPASVETQK